MNKRIYPVLLTLGAGLLLFRTVRLLLFENGLNSLMLWVVILTFIEMLIDFSCVIFSIKWFLKNNNQDIRISLRLGAAAAILHALRVLIYVLGKLEPLRGFGVRPEYRTDGPVDLFWVYFAAILSILGIAGVIIIWLIRRKRKE